MDAIPARLSRFLLVVALLATSVAHAGPFDDTLVQAPSLAAPERASLAGALAELVFGPGDLTRGSFSLPAPIAVPDERGPLLAGVVPSYSADAGISEWGQGWANMLEIRRHRDVGEVDFTTGDLFISPWGELARGDDGHWYPRGLSTLIRLSHDPSGAGAWTALTPDGTSYTFAAADAVVSARGTFAWKLSHVLTIDGDRSDLVWERKNATPRPFLAKVRWGGRGAQHEYELELIYETVQRPFDDYRAGVRLLLDRRVKEVRQWVRRTDTGAMAVRWSHALRYSDSPTGQAFYLTELQRTFASGQSEPPLRYEYDLALLGGELAPLPELDPMLEAWGSDALSGEKATFVDLDDDGVTELEHAPSMQTWRRSAGGSWSSEPLPPPTGAEDHLCRPDPGLGNRPRLLMRLAAGDAPMRVLSARSSAGTTTFVTCDLAGLVVGDTALTGAWAPGPLTRVSDLDRDLRPDLVRLGYGLVDVQRNEGDADGPLFVARPRQLLSPKFNAEAVWVDDANGDGVADLIARGPNVIVVWPGKGNLSFETTGKRYSMFGFDGRRLTDITIFDITWVDANKDGVLDLLTTYNGNVRLYTNDGYGFVQRDVPVLRTLGLEPGLPLAIDLAASGESEILLVHQRHARSLAFTAASNGLLVRADDGKGTEVRLAWRRAEAAPSVGARVPVLDAMTVASVGEPAVTWVYDYELPRLHSVGRFLLGYARVTRVAPLASETSELRIEDDVRVPIASTTTDALAPELYGFESTDYEEAWLHGVRLLRPTSQRSGVRSLDGTRELASVTETRAYTRTICPTLTVEQNRHGQLTREIELISPAGLPVPDLGCVVKRASVRGTHADQDLDFVHVVEHRHDALGHVLETRSIAPDGAITLQTVLYDGSGRILSLTEPATGSTRFTYGGGGMLSRIEDPDGTWLEGVRDPLTDSVIALSEHRGADAHSSGYAYDGLERLHRTWDSLSDTTASRPLTELSYRYAGGQLPALISVRGRVDGERQQDAVSFLAADGTPLAEASRLPTGWAFADLARNDEGNRSTEVFVRDALPITDVSTLDVNAIFSGATLVGRSQVTLEGDPVLADAIVQAGVHKRVTGRRDLENGALVVTTLENEQWSTRTALDEDARVIWRTDEAGKTTSMRYDALGRLVAITLPGGATQKTAFDGHGRPLRVVRPGIGAIDFRYDPVTGLLIEKRFYDLSGGLERIATMTHDTIGRPLVERLVHVPSGVAREHAFEYQGGLLSRVTGPGFEKRWTQRTDGRPLAQTTVFSGWRTVEEERLYFDDDGDAGRIVRIRDAQGVLLQEFREDLVLDAHGRPQSLRVNGAEVAAYVYDGNGRLAAVSMPDGQTLSWRRDPVIREVTGYTQQGPGWTAGIDIGLDARGQVAWEAHLQGSQSTRRDLAYDARGFLTSSSYGGDIASYTYDDAGLLVQASDTLGNRTFAREGAILRAGPHEYQFDDNGRVVRRDDLLLAYGPTGQVELAKQAGQTWSYLYDEVGQRIARTEGGSPVIAWVADGTLDATGFTTSVRVDDHVLGWVDAAGFHPSFTDPRGTPLTEDGELTVPSPYGVRDEHPGPEALADFSGKSRDAELGIVRMGLRDYDPVLGRFWSPDPLFFSEIEACAQSSVECNLYSYARNAPLLFRDEDGQQVALVGVGHHYMPLEVAARFALSPAGGIL